MKKWDKKHITTTILIVSIISFTLGVTVLSQYANQQPLSTASQAADTDISLESYCHGGYYEIPGEAKCSRAPNCGGYGYDELNTSDKMPNPQTCVGDSAPAGKKGCDGYVPVCCYEVARTGNFTKCIGYWERLWCAQSQCETARSRGASDSQCGGSCQCAHAFNSYCGADKQPVSLASRLGIANPPTATNTQTPPTNTPTRIPTATSIPTATRTPTTVPGQPTSTRTPTPTPTPIPPTQIPGQPTYTPSPTPTVTPTLAPGLPTPTRTPTPTFTAAHQTDPPIFPTYPPTESPLAQATPTDDPSTPVNESLLPTETPEPTMEWKSPKELARDVVTYERVDDLNKKTEQPLEAIKIGFDTVKTYDKQLEMAAESWIFRLRIRILKFLQQVI